MAVKTKLAKVVQEVEDTESVDGSEIESETEATPPAAKSKAKKAAEVAEPLLMTGKSGETEILLDRISQQEQRIAELTASAPPSGSLVLEADAAAEYKAYQKLGTPAKLAESLARENSRANAAERERDIYKASVIHGYDAEVLTLAIGDAVVENGKDTKGAPMTFVSLTDKDDETKVTKVPLPDWLKSNKAKLMPSLEGGKRTPDSGEGAHFGGPPKSKPIESRRFHNIF